MKKGLLFEERAFCALTKSTLVDGELRFPATTTPRGSIFLRFTSQNAAKLTHMSPILIEHGEVFASPNLTGVCQYSEGLLFEERAFCVH